VKIVSASRRTDIPAFYAPWLMNRIRAGFCVYPNPFFPQKHYRVSLRSEDVLGFVFWTRHAAPLMPRLPELDRAGFPYYFQYTVVGYPRTVDARCPPPAAAARTFCALSRQIGADRVIWRYDPILLTRELTNTWHRDHFRRLADALAPATRRLVVSVVDPYAKTRRRVGTTEDGVSYGIEAYGELLQWIAAEGAARGLRVQSCAEPLLRVPGIEPGRCVDGSLLCSLSGRTPAPKFPLHRQREGCLCHRSVDIGANDSCGFGCRYCYATASHERARETLRRHRPEWTCLTGDVRVPEPTA